ncbi:hypothetical protein E1B28_005702 [Marasmius oreades]|uniref:Uncharacterized protein n=1 Tax=Marasmius oreades TaxID=181124 RepID=A0A9P7UV35_9AGAR|nr:uncharacterized protein E1B28_005702 [Marasmius oreades]KAG7094895.1 hypothetical protein E1B28_005702 [Marasmius oreades]
MPLFKNNHHNTSAHHNEPITSHTGFNGHSGTGPGTGTGATTGLGSHPVTGAGGGMNHHQYPNDHNMLPEHHAPGTGFEQTGYGAQPHSGMNTMGHRQEYPGAMSDANDPYTAAGVGRHDNNIPPSGALHAGSAASGERHSGSSMGGKVERIVGEVVGSKSLQAKGMQKEQEARALKVQSSELAEAERLEREASMRRERAVAHGAHPANQHMGANHP